MNGSSPVTLTGSDGMAVIRMHGRHGNALNTDLLLALGAAFQQAAEDPGISGVLFTNGGRLFSPGLDLQELIDLDRPQMKAFMEQFAQVLLQLYLFPRPVLAALSGHAIAGGCVLALTADKRILRRGASIGLNEVKVGVPLPYGVTQLLRETVHRPALTDVALLGLNYRDEEAVAAGLVHAIHAGDGFEDSCRGSLEEFMSRGGEALSRTKGYLRQPAADRIRALDAAHHDDFLDCWFAPSTRQRIQGIVDGLRKKG